MPARAPPPGRGAVAPGRGVKRHLTLLRSRDGHFYLTAWLDGAEEGRIGLDLGRGGSSPAVEAVFRGESRRVEGEGGRSILSLPLKHLDEVLGVLTLWGGKEAFDEADLVAKRLADLEIKELIRLVGPR